jgi:hypothetical protein
VLRDTLYEVNAQSQSLVPGYSEDGQLSGNGTTPVQTNTLNSDDQLSLVQTLQNEALLSDVSLSQLLASSLPIVQFKLLKTGGVMDI